MKEDVSENKSIDPKGKNKNGGNDDIKCGKLRIEQSLFDIVLADAP